MNKSILEGLLIFISLSIKPLEKKDEKSKKTKSNHFFEWKSHYPEALTKSVNFEEEKSMIFAKPYLTLFHIHHIKCILFSLVRQCFTHAYQVLVLRFLFLLYLVSNMH